MNKLRTPVLLASLLLPVAAAAQQGQEGASEEGTFGSYTGERSTAAGMFLRFTESPTTRTHKAAVGTHTAFDGNRRGVTLETRGEVVVYASRALGVALLGGGAYVGASEALPEASHAFGGVKLQPLSQERFGVDLAFSVAYQSRGFNLRQAVATGILLGRRFGETQTLLNVVYGQGLEDDERYGSLRAGVLHPIVQRLYVGLDARFSADLELNEDEPEGEPEFEGHVGPVLSYTLSHLTLSATAGPATLRYRDGTDTRFGAVVSLGVAATL